MVVTTRCHPDALKVLEWHAAFAGYALRGWIRDMLEQRAAEITEQYELEIVPDPERVGELRFKPHPATSPIKTLDGKQ